LQQKVRDNVIIGFGHRAQVGKDTAGDWLVDQGWERLAFADLVRQVLYALDPVVDPVSTDYYFCLKNMVDTMGWEMTKNNTEVRGLLQKLGHGLREILDPDVWCRPVLKQAEALDEDGKNVVITDVRYFNEVAAIRNAGGRVWRIDRAVPRIKHPGEEQLDEFQDWDGVIDNNGSIEDLYEQVRALVMDYTLDVD